LVQYGATPKKLPQIPTRKTNHPQTTLATRSNTI
jgi:hypothetical protein